jgi:hypothetical protein
MVLCTKRKGDMHRKHGIRYEETFHHVPWRKRYVSCKMHGSTLEKTWHNIHWRKEKTDCVTERCLIKRKIIRRSNSCVRALLTGLLSDDLTARVT